MLEYICFFLASAALITAGRLLNYQRLTFEEIRRFNELQEEFIKGMKETAGTVIEAP